MKAFIIHLSKVPASYESGIRLQNELQSFNIHAKLCEGSYGNETLKRYSSFFKLFVNFQSYVDFFLLQDLVDNNYSEIKYFIPFKSFGESPLPGDTNHYKLYKEKAPANLNEK